MAKYVQIYLLPVPKKNLAAYAKLARAAGKLFREHGALKYQEFTSADTSAYGPLLLSGRLKPKADEVLIYAAVEYRSEKHRDQVTKRVRFDPRFDLLMPNPPLFDFKRMGFGGFKTLVEA